MSNACVDSVLLRLDRFLAIYSLLKFYICLFYFLPLILDVNRNDYRAWNGLGQAYEILGLNGYCIYYYSRAAQLKPDDSRMLVSLGEAYEKMDKIPNALKCYYKAHSTGDIEGMALFKLAK